MARTHRYTPDEMHAIAARISTRLKSGARTWARFNIPAPVVPAEPKRAHACSDCRAAGVADHLIQCRHCGRRLCMHSYRGNGQGEGVFVDGTGICRRCFHARVRAFNDHFGLARKAEVEPTEAPE